MGDENKKDVIEMISGLERDEEKKKISAHEELLDFFKFRLGRIVRQEKFKTKVQNKISKDIDEDKIDSKELINLYKTICSENTEAVDSVFSLIRPSATSTPLFDRKKEESIIADVTSGREYTPLELEKIDKFMRVMISLTAKEKNSEDNKDTP